MYRSIALFDGSYSFVRHYKRRASNTNASPQEVAQGTLLDVLSDLAATRDSVEHIIVCLDAPPYFRSDIFKEYKGQRPKQDPELTAIKKTLLERLDLDGYVTARVQGFEGDDLIATLCKAYAECPDIRIISADKDCGQLVSDTVRMFVPAVSGRPEEILGPEEIREKFGVYPKDMALYQTLVGDDGDNIKGVALCGKVTASKIIEECGGDRVKMGELVVKNLELGTKCKMYWKNLSQHILTDIPLWLKLTTLRTDVPIDAAALLVKRKVQPLVEVSDADDSEFYDPEEERKLMAEEEQQGFIPFGKAPDVPIGDNSASWAAAGVAAAQAEVPLKPGKVPTRAAGVPTSNPSSAQGMGQDPERTAARMGQDPPQFTHDVHGNKLPKATGTVGSTVNTETSAHPATTATANGKNSKTEYAPSATEQSASVVPRTQGPRKLDPIPSDTQMVRVPPPSWALAAQPSSANEMLAIAKTLINGRFLAHYGTPEGCFTVMALGRELGLGYMASLEGFHIVKNRPWPKAVMLKALAEKDHNCEWMQITSADAEHATIKTMHRKAGLLEYTYTAKRAQQAGYFSGPNAENWKTKTQEMLEARAMSKAAKRWYSGATMGLHSAEEMAEESGEHDDE